MQTNDFEKAYADFIDRREYDETQNALFMMIRVSFEAGWRAVGGEAPIPHKIFELVRSEAGKSEGNTKPED